MMKVLVVEDNEQIALALAMRLKAAGFEVMQEFDALGGIGRATKESPDLILLDLMMPAGGGLKVAERLRSLEDTSAIPIIFLTASKDPELKSRAMRYAPHAFVEKPYDGARLLDHVQEALGLDI